MLGLGKQTIMTIDQMNAYKSAYGDPLMKKDIFIALVVPFMVGFVGVMILFYYWWLAILGGLVGLAYGYIVLMQHNVQRVYHQRARIQRNRFVNNMTQLLTNPNETVVSALKWCAQDIVAEGEFKRDLDYLIIELMDATPSEVKAAFDRMSVKYRRDFVFRLFLDNLITASLEGRTDIKKLKDLKSWHNDVMEQTSIFMNNKNGAVRQYKITVGYTVGIIGILTFAFGFDGYLLYYAHSIIGWISSIVLLGLSFFYFHSFRKKLADDEVMEVKIWKK
jgi:hypothetical protein